MRPRKHQKIKKRNEVNIMKKILMMFVVTAIVLCTGCTALRNTIATENKEVINEELTNITDWDGANKIIGEVVTFRQDGALEYEPHGVYNLTGCDSKVYTFDHPNDFYEVVVMDDSEEFIFIIHNTGDHGVSFQSMVYKGGAFYGLTSNYVLFKEKDDSITAVSIEEKEHCEIDEYAFWVEDFDNLSKEEQETAIYPNGYYQCKF